MDTLKLYHFEPRVTVLGPGQRSAIWVQGCSLECPGCIVPDSHAADQGDMISPQELAISIASLDDIEGITISGGEPLEQVSALHHMVDHLHRINCNLTVMIFSGHKLSAWQQHSVEANLLLKQTDIFVDGAFVKSLAVADTWRGSSNQTIHFLSQRYSFEDYNKVQPNAMEFLIRPGKGWFMAGIPSPGTYSKLQQRFWPEET